MYGERRKERKKTYWLSLGCRNSVRERRGRATKERRREELIMQGGVEGIRGGHIHEGIQLSMKRRAHRREREREWRCSNWRRKSERLREGERAYHSVMQSPSSPVCKKQTRLYCLLL